MWVFGYGSLVWKVGFPFTRRVVGHVRGYKRRFWWWSEDHRGVPGAPGRVVNLLKDVEDSQVWGVAYHVEDSVWEAGVRDQLDHREKGGYTQHTAVFYPQEVEENNGLEPIEVTLYLGDESHRQFAGPDDLEVMARTIVTSVGPSGPNIDYLYNLCEAMRTLVPEVEDRHLLELEEAVKKLEKNKVESDNAF